MSYKAENVLHLAVVDGSNSNHIAYLKHQVIPMVSMSVGQSVGHISFVGGSSVKALSTLPRVARNPGFLHGPLSALTVSHALSIS